MEDIRLDEGAVLKTAGVNTLRGSSPWSSALIEIHSPVAQRRRHLPCIHKTLAPSRSTVRVRPGLLKWALGFSNLGCRSIHDASPRGAGCACKARLLEFDSQWHLFLKPTV